MKNIKKIVLKTALVLLGSALATNADAQHIEAKSQTINVGQVMFRQPVTVDYQLHNRGHHTLYIDQVRTSCGCTTVDYPLTSIRGDEFFTVRTVFDAKQMGHFTKQIGIYANGSKTPYILTLKGVVVEEVTDFVGDYPYQLGDLLTDQNVIEFDDVNRGDRPMAKIHILNNTDHPVQPVIMHLPDYLQAEISPSEIRAGRSGEAILTLDTRQIRDFGLTQTKVYLGSRPGDKVATNKEISISALLLPNFNDLSDAQLALAPRIQLSTTSLNLGPFGGKKKLKGEIDIQNTGKSTLDISHVEMMTIGLQISLNKTKLEPGEYAKLKITAVEKDLRLVKEPRILMISNDPSNPKVIIDVKTE